MLTMYNLQLTFLARLLPLASIAAADAGDERVGEQSMKTINKQQQKGNESGSSKFSYAFFCP